MSKNFVSTTNPCRMCRPMGACLAFKGIAGSMVVLHGSQGCSTYMRRYISSHFHEPVDIASSSLSEKSAIYGGAASLKQGIKNVVAKYSPAVLGIATTCLTETIGDNAEMIIRELKQEEPELEPVRIIPVATPSYSGSHVDGFHDACLAILRELARGGARTETINLFPGFLSPEDTRHLKEIMADFKTPAMILPDISDTLDGGIDGGYRRIPAGGATPEEIAGSGASAFSIEFNAASGDERSASDFLEKAFGVPGQRLPVPVGIRLSDLFFQTLSEMSLRPVPQKYQRERGRLLDAMVDAHKYLSGKRAAIYGDPDFVIGMTSFLADAGIQPIICASGSGSGRYQDEVRAVCAGLEEKPEILSETDFSEIAVLAQKKGAEILVGSSKGNHIARRLKIPLVRVGFPLHDRIGGQRILHVGYRGAMNLLDVLTNTIISREQEELGHGYSYM